MQSSQPQIRLEFTLNNGLRKLRAEQWVAAPLETVFGFFSRPANLARLTPPRQRLRLVSPDPTPDKMTAGMLVTYRLRVAGIPIHWKARIDSVGSDSFTDVLLKGPYRSWEHTHRFIAKDGGTLILDEIRYRTYSCRHGHKWFIQPQMEKLFRARGEAIERLFPSPS